MKIGIRRERKSAKDRGKQRGSEFRASVAAEREYAQALRGVAKEVRRISSVAALDPRRLSDVRKALAAYSELLTPWALSVSNTMVERVNKKAERAFFASAEKMSKEMKEFLRGSSSVATTYRKLIEENVKLIKSLPTEAGERVSKIVTEGLVSGTRADTMAKKIMETGDVTESRAKLIARTETSKASTALTEARAEDVGSEGYIWRDSSDGDVRPSHAAMDGKFVRWDSPPTLDGMTGHAGAFPNCRCYPEPVISTI